MGKCRYNPKWNQNTKYDWVGPVAGNDREAYCRICRKTFKLGTMGLTALDSHMRSNRHCARLKSRQHQAPIALFCGQKSSAASSTSATTTTTTTTNNNDRGPNPTSTAQPASLQTFCGSTPTLRSEVLWILKTVSDHHSYTSNEEIGELFRNMFSDSKIASTFTCGKNKTAYITKFGLAPFILKQLTTEVNKGPFVVMFDESLNKTTKKKQLDLHVRYWVDDMVHSRYYGSQFLGHAKAEDLIKNFRDCVQDLNLRQMVSVSMDGPNVNWRFFDMLQQEHAEQFGGAQLVVVGSCGLHTIHNAFKCAFTQWHMEKILRALHTIFLNVPARREDFIKLTKCEDFALSFCGHRWVENLPVAERAHAIWPNIKKYVEAVRSKQLPHPGTSSYDTIEQATRDALFPAKLHFFMTISRSLTPFLTKYQTNAPVLPFIGNDLADVLMSLLQRFVKKEHLSITPLQMVRLPVADRQYWVPAKSVDIGIGADSIIKELQKQSRPVVGELSVLQFRQECMEGLSKIVKKIQEKSPLRYPTVRHMTCLNPDLMKTDADRCQEKMKSLVKRFLQDKQLSGGYAAGDMIIQQFSRFLTSDVSHEDFVCFTPTQHRLDTFLHRFMSKPYPELWGFIQKLLLLSHGQATVERGFSINKEVEICNIQEDTVVAHRLVCDYVSVHGGVTKVPLTPELLASAAGARSKYRLHLETERSKKEKEGQGKKRKAAEGELDQLKKTKKALEEVCERLVNDADKLAEEAEGKQMSARMAELITKSNAFRRSCKEKREELSKLDKQIEAKKEELRHI